MALSPKRSPAPRGDAKDRACKAANENQARLIAENACPRHRWCAQIPMLRIEVSEEMRSFLVAMGGRNERNNQS